VFLMLIAFGTAADAELPSIQDNYKQALAQAKERKLPIFVECWAPW
jgi:endonuclease YncB( thermonuclease family)